MNRLPAWALTVAALTAPLAVQAQNCPARLAPGSLIPDPPMVWAKNGVIGGSFSAYFDGNPAAGRDGRYCLMYSADGTRPPVEAPVLRLAPGERIGFSLVNRMPAPATPPAPMAWNAALNPPGSGTAPCSPTAVMQDFATNLHFHGTNVKPVCGSDEVITSVAQPGGAAWQYNFALPLNAPPGLDFYHPHVHGIAQEQMLGGMSGALVIDSPNQMPNVVAGLRERILVLRDQDLAPAPAGVRYLERPDLLADLALPQAQRALLDAAGLPASDALLRGLLAGGTALTRDAALPGAAALPSVVPPWKDISVNQVQVVFSPGAGGVAAYSPAGTVKMEAAREFWRVANVSADSYLRLQVRFKVNGAPVAQTLRVVAMDGVPISAPNGQLLFDDNSLAAPGKVPTRPNKTVAVKQVLLSPGGRVEFIVDAPAAGQQAELVSLAYETQADANPFRVLARVDGPAPGTLVDATRLMPQPTASAARKRFVDTGPATPKAKPDHLLYFSQNATEFFVTEDASTALGKVAPLETAFSMQGAPAIYVPKAAIQEWKVENRSPEAHAFHIHQIRFRVLKRWPAPTASAELFDEFALRDTVDLPGWNGVGAPPSVTLRMFFNEPDILGNFMYHCHILEHEDKGMMAIVRVVEPALMPLAANRRASGGTALAQAGGKPSAKRPEFQAAPLRVSTAPERPEMRDRLGRLIDPQVCVTPPAKRVRKAAELL